MDNVGGDLGQVTHANITLEKVRKHKVHANEEHFPTGKCAARPVHSFKNVRFAHVREDQAYRHQNRMLKMSHEQWMRQLQEAHLTMFPHAMAQEVHQQTVLPTQALAPTDVQGLTGPAWPAKEGVGALKAVCGCCDDS
jgi:hypothetical protein